MTDQEKRRGYGPATVNISDPSCVADGMGMATLSTVITVHRLDAETIDSLVVLVNGSSSASLPVEQAGSPTTPNPGEKLHTYDWSDTVDCDATYNVQAVAQITLVTTAGSSIKPKDCPACP